MFMKQKSYSMILVALMALISFTADGQFSPFSSSLIDQAISTVCADGTVTYEMPSAAPRLEGQPASEILLHLTYDMDSLGANGQPAIQAQSFTLLNEGNTKYFGRLSNTDKSLVTFTNVPAGTYVLYIQWHINDDGYSWRHFDGVRDIVLLIEDVVVDGNFEMSHDIAEAKNRLHFGRILPNGEVPNPGFVTIENGVSSFDGTENVYGESYFRALFMKNRASFVAIFTNATYRGASSITNNQGTTISDMSNSIDLYINDVSENIQVYNVYRGFWGENLDPVYITYDLKDGINGDIDVQPEPNFTTHVDLFQMTPRGSDFSEQTPGTLTTILKNGASQLSTQVNIPNMLPAMSGSHSMTSYFTAYESEGPGTSDVSSTFNAVYNEAVTTKSTIMGIQYTYCYTMAPTMRFEADGNYYNNFGIPISNSLIYDTIAGANSYVINPHFSPMIDENKPVRLNANCPIMVIQSTNNVNNNGKRFAFNTYCMGRHSEYRQVDNDSLRVSVKYNGEEVHSDYATLSTFYNNFNRAGNPDGIINTTFINNNVNVDGIDGKNVVEFEFDMTQTDWTAPTITTLRFLDAEGNVTDRFANASDGKVEITGGDFNYGTLSSGMFAFNCKPITMEVSYAPNGSDEWQSLEVTENPDLYFYPAFGQLFEGSLSEVSAPSENGWYDLKVRVVDETGNWQDQIVSPAFKLDENVTVLGDVTGDGVVDGIDINTLINVILGKASNIEGADVNGDGVVNGTDLNIVINIVLDI